MSDFDRNATAVQYGRPLTRAEAAVIDEGLRAYMLRVYNYMVIGLAITGFAALGIYMLSVTSDPTLAYQGARPLARGMYLTQIGFSSVREPAQMGRDPGAARARLLPRVPHPEHASRHGADHVLDLRGAGRRIARARSS